MDTLPQDATKIELEGATVPFFKYEENNRTIYLFDSSKCSHPEPMVNAMVGLKTIKDGENLIMINSKAPMGLFPKIEDDFSYEVEELSNQTYKIKFTKKTDNLSKTDFNDTSCSGS